MTLPKNMNEPQPSYGEVPAGVDADIKGSLAAIRRAARRARQVAQQTGTDLIVQRGGKVIRIKPPESGPA